MNSKIMSLVLSMGLGLFSVAAMGDTSADVEAKLAQALQKKSNGKVSSSSSTSDSSEDSEGETGKICSAGNKMSYGSLANYVDMDKIEFKFENDEKTLVTFLPVKQGACFCPALQAYKQDGKVFVVIENDFFNQGDNEKWLYVDGDKSKGLKKELKDGTGNRRKTRDLQIACMNAAKNNESIPSTCVGGKDGKTADNHLWIFKTEMKMAKNVDKMADGKKSEPPKPNSIKTTASVPVFYLTAESITTFIPDYRDSNVATGVEFDSKKFSGNNDCATYKVENFPVNKSKKLKDNNYHYITLSPEDQIKAAELTSKSTDVDCPECLRFYNQHKNDAAFYSALNNQLTSIISKMHAGKKHEIEVALKGIKACKTKDSREETRTAAKELIKAMETYEVEVLDPLWKDLKDQREKRKTAKDQERKEIDVRIKKLKESIGELNDLREDIQTAVKRLAGCNLRSEGQRVFDIWGKAFYYSESSNTTTDKDIERKLAGDNKKFKNFAEEEKKEYLARTGEKKYAQDFLYKSKVYQQRANLSSSTYQQKLIELQSACATNVFGYQTNPVRCSALQKQLAKLQKKATLTNTYYNNLANKAQNNASSFLNLEAQSLQEAKAGGGNSLRGLFNSQKDNSQQNNLTPTMFNALSTGT